MIFPEHSLSAVVAGSDDPTSQLDVAIVDLDNCISDDKWRWNMFDMHLPLPNDRYSRYHDACESDAHANANVIRDLSRRYKLIVFTSRPECVRHKTQRWLNRWRIPNVGMFMRPNDNHEPSVPLKRQMLLALPHHIRPRYAIDDRVDILDMYADEGVSICQRVIINNPEHTHP